MISKKELILSIRNWMRKTDYIELQAVRGQITRNSKKYQDYIKQYNIKLEVLRNLEKELEEKGE